MRVSCVLVAAVVVVMAALVHAGPMPDEEQSGGSKTFQAIKEFFSPVTSYFQSIPAKSPSDLADDVSSGVGNVRDWASENDAIQALRGALNPVKDWIKEKASVVKDQTFSDMYENVKTSVQNMDERVGTWLEDRITTE